MLKGRWLALFELVGVVLGLAIVGVLLVYSWDHAMRALYLGDSTIDAAARRCGRPSWSCRSRSALLFVRLLVSLWAYLRVLLDPSKAAGRRAGGHRRGGAGAARGRRRGRLRRRRRARRRRPARGAADGHRALAGCHRHHRLRRPAACSSWRACGSTSPPPSSASSASSRSSAGRRAPAWSAPSRTRSRSTTRCPCCRCSS